MKKRINITDIDGTLVRGSLVLDFFGFLKPENPVFKAWKRNPKDENLIKDCADEFTKVIKRYKKKNIDKMAEKFIFEYDDFYIESLKVISKNRNHRTYLISGSPNFLVKPLAKRLEKEMKIDITGFGSVYQSKNGKYTGEVLTPMFVREEKLKKINQLKKNYKIDCGIGDTSSDEFILKFAEKRFLVEPNPDTLQFFCRKRYKRIELIL